MSIHTKHLLGIMALFFLVFPNNLWAHPPSDMKLEYDQNQKNLHVEITHTAHDPREHHIRKILITHNDKEPLVRYFATQTRPSELIVDVPLEAKAQDKIRVMAICNEGGQKEETLIVPPPSN